MFRTMQTCKQVRNCDLHITPERGRCLDWLERFGHCGERGRHAHTWIAAPLDPVDAIAASRAEIPARPFCCRAERREENWDYLVFVS